MRRAAASLAAGKRCKPEGLEDRSYAELSDAETLESPASRARAGADRHAARPAAANRQLSPLGPVHREPCAAPPSLSAISHTLAERHGSMERVKLLGAADGAEYFLPMREGASCQSPDGNARSPQPRSRAANLLRLCQMRTSPRDGGLLPAPCSSLGGAVWVFGLLAGVLCLSWAGWGGAQGHSVPTTKTLETTAKDREEGDQGARHGAEPTSFASRGDSEEASRRIAPSVEAQPRNFLMNISKDGHEICNASAQMRHTDPLHLWNLDVGWRRACEKKVRGVEYPYQRNWCWIGLKMQCHADLKAHKSWTSFMEKGLETGDVPSPRNVQSFHPLERPELCDRPSHGQRRNWTAFEWAKARVWFESLVHVYVLNLPSDLKRWEMVSARLTALHIQVTHVPGVDMRVPRALALAKEAGWVPQDFNFTAAQVEANTWAQQMGNIAGTLGCASAHFKVQEKAIKDGGPLAVVLEDDSWIEDDFVPRLWSLVREELPCDWEVVALNTRCGYGKCVSQRLMRVQPDRNEPAWRCRHGVNWGMHGILYRTSTLARVQERWKRTVFNESRPHCLDVDVALASISDKVGFYAVPACQKPGFLREMDMASSRFGINEANVDDLT